MHLKRLELYGYKSFATRCVFEFGEGITAIVGPNGSGKSNIADAMRWVMGEQSYSTLRAKSSGDMIFAGSRHRARLGMAEVLIVLDNSDGSIPLDYTEVVIGRRAYRSGENEYLLNGRQVRYRDVLSVLGGAGLMRTSYTIIGQGLVDAALSLRPEARRELIEEAAGIAPHLRKRAEAIRRIAETERNLERVNDILGEVHPRAASLRRQAERAEEHLLLTQDLEELQRVWYGYQWRQRQQRLDRAEERLKQQATRLESQRAYAHSFQERRDQIRQRQAELRELIEDLSEKHAALRDDLEITRRRSAVSGERTRLYHEQRESLSTEARSLASRRDILQKEIDRTSQELAQQKALVAQLREELEVARGELTHSEDSRQALAEQVAAQQGQMTRVVATISEARARLEQLSERRAELTNERKGAEDALLDLDQRLGSLGERAQPLAEHERSLSKAQAELEASQAALKAEMVSAGEQVSDAEKTMAGMATERDRLESRRELLTRVRQELTGYYPGVREVLRPKAGLAGLLGTAAKLMKVPQEYERAIEAALGSRLQHVIAERWEDAEAAIEHLKRTRAGWVTFLPLDTLRSGRPLALRQEHGVVGVASTLVRFDEHLRPAFELLLGKIVVVRDLAAARGCLKRRMGASLFVTLAGETIHPAGAVSGGTRRRRGNLLAQEREWRALPGQMEALDGQLDAARERRGELQAHLDDLQSQAQGIQDRLAHLSTEREAAHAASVHHAQQVRELEREREWRASHLERAIAELERLCHREESLRDELADLESEELAAVEHLTELRRELASCGGEEARQRVAELETRAAVAERTVHSQHTLLESHRQNLEELARQIDEKRAQDTRLGQILEELSQALQTHDARLANLDAEAMGLQLRLKPAREESSRLETEQRTVERRGTQSLELLQQAEAEFNQATLERDRAKDDRSLLGRDILRDLGPTDLPDAVSHQLRLELGDDIIELPEVTSITPGLGEEIRQLKARLRRLGSINPNAPQEYQQLLDRQTFLQGQAADLRGAIGALHEVIEELDTIIERDFMSTFEQVRDHFSDYFRMLFDGGSAQLALSDPSNISATGIEIIARPPGKRPQNLALLSGGERALTASALLFALLRANSVPFCFLDEVDATLDDTNVGRFRDLLEEHAQATQFVVITHNRRTIEAASTIYGISMGEQGISQCISLKLGSEGKSGQAA